MHSTLFRAFAIVAALAGSSAVANAAMVISSAPTSNVACAKATCTATAANAVLNVTHLQNMLTKENPKLVSGSSAKSIRIAAALTWTSSHTLTLDAYRSITVNKSVVITGSGGLALLTNDGGTSGELSFGTKGNISFWNLSSILTINGATYTLVNRILSLQSGVAAHPTGHFAFAANYDASGDGTYPASPIDPFAGTFEGLGNSISNLSISPVSPHTAYFGLFSMIQNTAVVENLNLINARIKLRKMHVGVGILTSGNYGTVSGIFASGQITVRDWDDVGGIAGTNSGIITNSHSTVTISGGSDCYLGGLVGGNSGEIRDSFASGSVVGCASGGLIGANDGYVDTSYATGTVGGPQSGGLVSLNRGAIRNSYATGAVSGGDSAILGGLVGRNSSGGTLPQGIIVASYSTGGVVDGASSTLGGLVGEDDSTSGSITNSYWDTTTSGIANSSQGAGNISNDLGITGLTTVQLQAGLPTGFDPSIWAESSTINSGLPYLLDIPPT